MRHWGTTNQVTGKGPAREEHSFCYESSKHPKHGSVFFVCCPTVHRYSSLPPRQKRARGGAGGGGGAPSRGEDHVGREGEGKERRDPLLQQAHNVHEEQKLALAEVEDRHGPTCPPKTRLSSAGEPGLKVSVRRLCRYTSSKFLPLGRRTAGQQVHAVHIGPQERHAPCAKTQRKSAQARAQAHPPTNVTPKQTYKRILRQSCDLERTNSSPRVSEIRKDCFKIRDRALPPPRTLPFS